MDTYLQLCRSNLPNLSQFKSVSFVIGNESCDLDSAISAIVLAYVKYHERIAQLANSSFENHEDDSIIVLPVLNVPHEDLHLRREIVFWLEQVLQFDLKTLICRDEIDYEQLNSSSCEITISLVDHNENKELARLLPRARFEEIIDHHQPTYQDGACQVTDQNKVLLDTTVGSCCSLIALRFIDCNIQSKFTKQEISSDSQIALLLYGPILLDTICFNHTAKRFNVKDYEAVNKLEDLLKHTADADSSLFDRNDVYQRLVDAKNSLSGLSFNELLRKDMKIVESVTDNNLAICICAITGTKLTELTLKDNMEELKCFCELPPSSAVFSESHPRLFNAIVLLSMDNRIPNNLQRQLAVYCGNKHLMRTIATCIERNSELELELITASETLRIYNQNNLTATRKMVLPIISTILNGPSYQRSNSNDASNAKLSSARSSNKQSTFLIATGEVDPEYLLSFKSKTISVPEFDEFIRQHSNDETKSIQSFPANETVRSDSPENAKRSDSVGSADSHPSAPSSLIQQPDSYYGSYIEDSFVGDFVGDYMDPNNDHLQENILVMDADGQNLVMMNPNETINHAHEIEFDFDSFGPESIIYAGNVENINPKTTITNGKQNEKREENIIEEDVQEGKEQTNGDDSGFDKDISDSQSITIDKQSSSVSLPKVTLENEEKNVQSEPHTESEDLKADNSEVTLGTLDSGASSISDSTPVNGASLDSVNNTEPLHENELAPKSDDVIEKEILEEKPIEDSSNTQHNGTASALSPFVRNNTLTRSQRKKVLPQVNIKNLIMDASNTYSPPVLDSSLIPSFQPTNGSHDASGSANGDKKIDQNENFIISSLAQRQHENASTHHSEGNEPVSHDHPLSISTSYNSINENTLNPYTNGGLTRQPSMKKKVPVNYDMLLHNNYDKEDEGDKLANSSQMNDSNATSTSDPLNMNASDATNESALPEHGDDRAPSPTFFLGNGESRPIDMRVIEPYKKVISHGGYMHASADGRNIEGSSPAIIIFSACYLPDRARRDYHYVMDNLFMYVLTTLHNMIADDYILIYLHNGGLNSTGNNMPTFGWLKRCYQMIDRRLKKNLKGLYILHPTFWLKTLIIMSKPFISSKFSRKLKFVRSLDELRAMIPIEGVAIPEPVKTYDQLVTAINK